MQLHFKEGYMAKIEKDDKRNVPLSCFCRIHCGADYLIHVEVPVLAQAAAEDYFFFLRS